MESPRPLFTRFFFPDMYATELQIPATLSFLALPEVVLLRDKYNNLWQVHTKRFCGDWYFLDGWAKFVQDNSIAEMDLLVFQYTCEGVFDFKILGLSGCEKRGVGNLNRADEVEEETEGEDDDNEIEKYRVEIREKSNQNKAKEVQQEDTDDEACALISINGRQLDAQKVVRFYKGNCDEEDIDDDEAFELVSAYKNNGKEVAKELTKKVRDDIASGSGKSCKKLTNIDCCGKAILNEASEEEDTETESFVFISSDDNKGQEDVKKMKPKERGAVSKKQGRKRTYVDWRGDDIFEAGFAPRPTCTYFVTTMKPKRMNELYIPKALLDDKKLHLPRKLLLIDPSGRRYTSKLVQWTDGRTFYKGGWNRLLRRNDVYKEDYCICEFGEGGQKDFLFISFVKLDRD